MRNKHLYGYNLAGQRTNQVWTDDNVTAYTYDNMGQLKTAFGKESNGTDRRNERFGYAYDAAGNLNNRTNNALIQTFSVNNLNALTSATRTGTLTVAGSTAETASSVTVNSSNAALYLDKTFAVENFSLTNGVNAYTAVAQDSQRTNATSVSYNLPDSVNFNYDLNGNLLSDGNRAFDYDDENQLIRITVANSWKTEFTYDGKMRMRIRKEFSWIGGTFVQTSETRYVYDGMLAVQERNGNNTPMVSYTRGRDLSGSFSGAGGIGGLLARTDAGSSPATHAYYHADGNGNVTAMANTAQVLVARYIYDPFGNTLAQYGSLADANVMRFSSKENHAKSGLYYYGYRFYDPNLQRWPNRDPIQERGGIALYSFCNNDPNNRFDAFGLEGRTYAFVSIFYNEGDLTPAQKAADRAHEAQHRRDFWNGKQFCTPPWKLEERGFDKEKPILRDALKNPNLSQSDRDKIQKALDVAESVSSNEESLRLYANDPVKPSPIPRPLPHWPPPIPPSMPVWPMAP